MKSFFIILISLFVSLASLEAAAKSKSKSSGGGGSHPSKSKKDKPKKDKPKKDKPKKDKPKKDKPKKDKPKTKPKADKPKTKPKVDKPKVKPKKDKPKQNKDKNLKKLEELKNAQKKKQLLHKLEIGKAKAKEQKNQEKLQKVKKELTAKQQAIMKELQAHMITRGLGDIKRGFLEADLPGCLNCTPSKNPTGFGLAELDSQGNVTVVIQGVRFPNWGTMEVVAQAVANYILNADPRANFVSVEIYGTSYGGAQMWGLGSSSEFQDVDPAVFGQGEVDAGFAITSGLSLIYNTAGNH